MSTSHLTQATAETFPQPLCEGFAPPHLGWSAFSPKHLEGLSGGEMISTVWLGEPAELKSFLEALAAHYEEMKDQADPDDFDGVSLAFWEQDGVAMAAEFCTGRAFVEQKNAGLLNQAKAFNQLLDGRNDNHPADILQNRVDQAKLDVNTRLQLAHFLTAECIWVFEEDQEPNGWPLEGFTPEDKNTLLAILTR